jgi:hypothetical protein
MDIVDPDLPNPNGPPPDPQRMMKRKVLPNGDVQCTAWTKNAEWTERNGLKHGRYTRWHDNGRVASRIDFAGGVTHGLYIRYDEYGQVKEDDNNFYGWPSDPPAGVNIRAYLELLPLLQDFKRYYAMAPAEARRAILLYGDEGVGKSRVIHAAELEDCTWHRDWTLEDPESLLQPARKDVVYTTNVMPLLGPFNTGPFDTVLCATIPYGVNNPPTYDIYKKQGPNGPITASADLFLAQQFVKSED